MQQLSSHSERDAGDPDAVTSVVDPTGTVRIPAHDLSATDTRELYRQLRRPQAASTVMPESGLWQAWLELNRRGEAAGEHFVRSLKSLHRRRAMGTVELPTADPHPDEHRMSDDPYVGELWKAYKRCIAQSRTGPAAQLLRDLEAQII